MDPIMMDTGPPPRQFEHECFQKDGRMYVKIELGFYIVRIKSMNSALAHALAMWEAELVMRAVETPQERWN